MRAAPLGLRRHTAWLVDDDETSVLDEDLRWRARGARAVHLDARSWLELERCFRRAPPVDEHAAVGERRSRVRAFEQRTEAFTRFDDPALCRTHSDSCQFACSRQYRNRVPAP